MKIYYIVLSTLISVLTSKADIFCAPGGLLGAEKSRCDSRLGKFYSRTSGCDSDILCLYPPKNTTTSTKNCITIEGNKYCSLDIYNTFCDERTTESSPYTFNQCVGMARTYFYALDFDEAISNPVKNPAPEGCLFNIDRIMKCNYQGGATFYKFDDQDTCYRRQICIYNYNTEKVYGSSYLKSDDNSLNVCIKGKNYNADECNSLMATFTQYKIPLGFSTGTKTIPPINATKTIPTSTTKTKTVPTSTTTTKTKTVPTSTTTTKTKTVPTSTTTTSTKTIPTSTTSTKTIPTSTTSTKTIPTSTTTTSTKTIPTSTTTTSTKTIPTSTTTTSTKTIPTSTTTTSTKTIPTSTTTTSTKTIPTSTTTTSTKTIPTSTTTTSTKTIPTSTTTTSTKTIPTTCKSVITVTVTEKETITKKDYVTVTVTVKSTPTQNSNCASKWAQCGGVGFNGPTCCEAGSTCHEVNQYYSQCI